MKETTLQLMSELAMGLLIVKAGSEICFKPDPRHLHGRAIVKIMIDQASNDLSKEKRQRHSTTHDDSTQTTQATERLDLATQQIHQDQ